MVQARRIKRGISRRNNNGNEDKDKRNKRNRNDHKDNNTNAPSSARTSPPLTDPDAARIRAIDTARSRATNTDTASPHETRGSTAAAAAAHAHRDGVAKIRRYQDTKIYFRHEDIMQGFVPAAPANASAALSQHIPSSSSLTQHLNASFSLSQHRNASFSPSQTLASSSAASLQSLPERSLNPQPQTLNTQP
jgi:hypothetical protein